jgi:hypothetical protein
MSSLHPDPQSFERRRWLIAVFDNEARARRAAEDAQQHGTQNRSIRIGSSLDKLASIGAERRGETHHVGAGGTGPRRRFGAFVSRLLGVRPPRESLAPTVGTMLALPDTEPARRSLLRAGPERVDVFGAGGHLISTLVTNDPGERATLDQVAQPVPDAPNPD